MEQIAGITRTTEVSYGDRRMLLELFHSRRIMGAERTLDDLTWRRRGTRMVEVTLFPYEKPNPAEDSSKKRQKLVAQLKAKRLEPCTFWEIAAFYPPLSIDTFMEREKFFDQVGGTHAVLLLGVPEKRGLLNIQEPAYIYKGRFELHYCFQMFAPTSPIYYAGYRVVR